MKKLYRGISLILSSAFLMGAMSACSKTSVSSSSVPTTSSSASVPASSNEDVTSSVPTEEIIIYDMYSTGNYDYYTNEPEMEYIIMGEKIIINSADSALEVVKKMLEAAIKENTFTREEIYYMSDYGVASIAEFVETPSSNPHMVSCEDKDGMKMKAVFYDDEHLSFLGTASDVFLTIRSLMKEGEYYELALESIEWYQKIRENQNIVNAADPIEYLGTTYDLSNPSSVRTLVVALSYHPMMKGVAHAVLKYYYNEIDRDQLEHLFNNAPEAKEMYDTYNPTSYYESDGRKLYEYKGSNRVLMQAIWTPIQGVGNDGKDIVITSFSNEGQITEIYNDDDALKCLYALTTTGDTRELIAFIGAYEYNSTIRSLYGNEIENGNYDLEFDYGNQNNYYSLDSNGFQR